MHIFAFGNTSGHRCTKLGYVQHQEFHTKTHFESTEKVPSVFEKWGFRKNIECKSVLISLRKGEIRQRKTLFRHSQNISQKQHLIKADFEVALQLATELDFLFEKGTFDEKRLLCETVFKRVYLKEGRVSEVDLNAPFGLIASRGKGSGTVQSGWPLRTQIELSTPRLAPKVTGVT